MKKAQMSEIPIEFDKKYCFNDITYGFWKHFNGKKMHFKRVLHIGAREAHLPLFNRINIATGGTAGVPKDSPKYRGDFTFDSWTIMEIFPANVRTLRKATANFEKFNIIEGDVRNINDLVEGKYDLVIWDNGPEHLQKSEFEETYNKIMKHVGWFFIIACPYGHYSQGALYGNPHEVHKATFLPEDFEKYFDFIYYQEHKSSKHIVCVNVVEKENEEQ